MINSKQYKMKEKQIKILNWNYNNNKSILNISLNIFKKKIKKQKTYNKL